MTLDALSDEVARVSDLYAQRCDVRRDDDWYLLKLQEELGELTQAHLRLTGRARTQGQDAHALEDARAAEAADLLCHVLLYCRRFGIDVQAAVEAKWLKRLESA